MLHVITFFGLLTMVFGVSMIWSPRKWSAGIVSFSQHPAFHPFEVVTRLICGAAFLIAADQTLYPSFMRGLGFMLLIVGVGLLFTPPAKHRAFAAWSAQRFIGWFRPSGLAALLFGAFLIHATIAA